MNRAGRLGALYWAVLALLATPLALLALTSLSDGLVVGYPLGRPTLRWYAEALADPAFGQSFALSLGVAASSSALAVVAGTWIALAAGALGSRALRWALRGGALLPLATPGIVHAVALRIAIQTVGLDPGPLAMVLGHAVHATPYAVIMVGVRLASLPPEQVGAAKTLGAGPARVFLRVVLPWLWPALFGSAALAALTSFDDFIRSFLLGGYDQTLPVLIFGRLRSGLTPEINAMATLVLLAACALGLAADCLAGHRRRPGALPLDPAKGREAL
jgi:spermidine/putrescine transport system permease protein